MTHRERVLAAFGHGEQDETVVELAGGGHGGGDDYLMKELFDLCARP